MTNRPGGVFVYDSEDKMNPDEMQRAQYSIVDYRVLLVYVLTGALIFLALTGVNFWAMYLLGIPHLALFGKIILFSLYLALAVLIVALTGICVMWLYNRAQKAGLFNVRYNQMHVGRMRDVSDRYFDVEQTNAANVFRSARNLTYSPNISYAERRAQIEEEQYQTPSEEIQVLTLTELQERGLIARSGNSLLIGFKYDE